MKKKVIYRIIWGVCLFLIVVVSMGFCLKVYSTSFDISGIYNIILPNYSEQLARQHLLDYTVVQIIDIYILVCINLSGIIISKTMDKPKNIHFYGITNILISTTLILVNMFKYQQEYSMFLSSNDKIANFLTGMTIVIVGIAIISYSSYITKVVKKKKTRSIIK